MIGDRLKYFRKLKQLSQEQMADLMYMSQGQYSRLETGSTGFNIERILRAAKILEIDVTQLLNADKETTKD
jgi:transcriptional regulator with XRE-family HTH domain